MQVVWMVRVSTDQQDTARQLKARDETIARHNLLHHSTVEIVGVSGTRVENSPEWARVQRTLKNLPQPILGVEFGPIQWCQQNCITILTHDGLIEPDSIGSFWRLLIGAGQAGAEIRTMKRRIRGARDAMAARGQLPYANHFLPDAVTYDRDTGRWDYVEPKATLIREAVDGLLTGKHTTNQVVLRFLGQVLLLIFGRLTQDITATLLTVA